MNFDISKYKNEHGQPFSNFRHGANLDKKIDELMGLAKGLVADGSLVDAEVDFLRAWMAANVECAERWPASVLFERIEFMLSDGVIDETERSELMLVLQQLATPAPVVEEVDDEGTVVVSNRSTTLPLDDPAPVVVFQGKAFCVTGEFAFGVRSAVQAAIQERGGSIHDAPKKTTDFLVVGVTASRDWIHSNAGRKIEKAVAMREKGSLIAIIGEEHWTAALK